MKGQSYTSTPPMGRTVCTEPQCLYKGDLYLLYRTFSISVIINLVITSPNFLFKNKQINPLALELDI